MVLALKKEKNSETTINNLKRQLKDEKAKSNKTAHALKSLKAESAKSSKIINNLQEEVKSHDHEIKRSRGSC